jgi:radical SAM superfamily enzyme YgiQ (UPF0313 family)
MSVLIYTADCSISFDDLHSLDNVEPVIRCANEVGIRHIEENFIIGSHPEETIDDLEATRKLIPKLPLNFIAISVIAPYAGPPNYEYMNDRNYIETRDWGNYVMFGQTPGWRTTHFLPKDLLTYQKRVNRSFYLRPSYIARMASRLRIIEELRYNSKSGISFLKWLTGVSLVSRKHSKMNLDAAGFRKQYFLNCFSFSAEFS